MTENEAIVQPTRPSLVAPLSASLFQQPWWLEAAGGPALEWTRCLRDGRVVGALAFVRHREWGFVTLDMPPYTRTLGPILDLPESKRARRLRNAEDIVGELIRGLPAHDRFQCMLDPQDDTTFALALAGCSVGQNFTFRTQPGWVAEEQWMELHGKTRNLIRTAGSRLAVAWDGSIDDVIALSAVERGSDSRSDAAVLHRIADAALARGQMCTLVARDRESRIVAAATLVWDDRVVYYWQSARDIRQPVPGANSLLIWESLLFAQRKQLVFDIDGYHSATAARFVASFNLDHVVRASVVHMSRRGRVAQAFGRLLGRGTGFGVQPIAETLSGSE